MTIDRFIFAFAGVMVLVSLFLGYFVHNYWFILTVFVGLNMTQAAFTGFCPFAIVLKKLGVKSGVAFD